MQEGEKKRFTATGIMVMFKVSVFKKIYNSLAACYEFYILKIHSRMVGIDSNLSCPSHL